MATVTRNPDDTFTVTLTPREQKSLTRWAASEKPPITKAAKFTIAITGMLASKTNDYRAEDEPKRRDQYRAAPDNVQDQIDALLGV